MRQIPDHPAIRMAERTGYGAPLCQEPICPVCGAQCDTVYINKYGEILGCEECVDTEEAFGRAECFPEQEN